MDSLRFVLTNLEDNLKIFILIIVSLYNPPTQHESASFEKETIVYANLKPDTIRNTPWKKSKDNPSNDSMLDTHTYS